MSRTQVRSRSQASVPYDQAPPVAAPDGTLETSFEDLMLPRVTEIPFLLR